MELMTISLLTLTILALGVAANDARPRTRPRVQPAPVELDTERV